MHMLVSAQIEHFVGTGDGVNLSCDGTSRGGTRRAGGGSRVRCVPNSGGCPQLMHMLISTYVEYFVRAGDGVDLSCDGASRDGIGRACGGSWIRGVPKPARGP